MSKTIQLTQGQVATVSDCDYDWLMQWKWSAMRNRNTFYAVRGEWDRKKKYNRRVWMHRELLAAEPGQYSDHISGDGRDNRRCNLRLATQTENIRNQRVRKRGSSQYKGVYRFKSHGCWKWWRAMIGDGHGRQRSLGLFTDERAAARAYDAAAIKYFGAFCRLNFPQTHQSERKVS